MSFIILNEFGMGLSQNKIIIKTDKTPQAISSNIGKIYIWSGQTDSNFIHGYIYECVADINYNISPLPFNPEKIVLEYTNATYKTYTSDGEALADFIKTVLHYNNPENVKYIKFTLQPNSMDISDPTDFGNWFVQCKDINGNILIDNYMVYATDLTVFGFTFIYPHNEYSSDVPLESDQINWSLSYDNIHLERINVQPDETGSADYDVLSNKPQINGVTLNGNKTGVDLGLTPSTVTIAEASVTISEIKSNTNYKLTSSALTDITFSGCEISDEVTTIDFTTGENDVTFYDNSGIDWADGETPHFYSYQHYWIIISKGVGFVKEIY